MKIVKHPRFDDFFATLKDPLTVAAITARIVRLQAGNAGDSKCVGGSVQELRIDHGPGWRIYYAQVGQHIVMLLGGGTKRKQQHDIARYRGGDRKAERFQEAITDIEEQFMNNTCHPDPAAEEFDLNAIEALPEFDAAHYLRSEEAIAAYLNQFIDDPAMMADALGVAARARGMTEVARHSGITREALYKALRPTAAPRLDTIVKVMAAFGVRLVVEPIPKAAAACAAGTDTVDER